MSSYIWYDSLFENKAEYEKMREEMNDCLKFLNDRQKEYAIYRFGLNGQEIHSKQETAEHFSISTSRVSSLDNYTLRHMGIKVSKIRSNLSYLLD